MTGLTAEQIAQATGTTSRWVRERAREEAWMHSVERAQGGPRRLFPVSALPADVRTKALAWMVKQQRAALPVPAAPAAPPAALANLKGFQQTTATARAALVAEVRRLVVEGGCSQSKAAETVVDLARLGQLPPDLQALIPLANARAGKGARAQGGRTLSRSTLLAWCAAAAQADGSAVALAPAAPAEAGVPAWAGPFLDLWGRPHQPALTTVLADLPATLPATIAPPSYDQARAFLRRLDAITRHAGRMGPRALKALKVYTIRTVDELWPGAVFVGDGHTFKAEVAHPTHGRPFRPEVTAIIDVFTRRVVGWSVSLAENTWAVADALRHAVTTTTTPDIWYYDNGSGANNKLWDADVTGMLARLRITKMNSAPWNSQARGVIERLNSTLWHKAAKKLPTYMGQDMDREARQRAFKVTRRDIAATGTSRALMPWADFIAFVGREVEAYNERPHRFLRGRSPNEVWAAAEAAGWTPDPLPAAEAADLFRPAIRRKVSRGRVAHIGNLYGHDALAQFEGETVMVAFDIHDASHVWVRALDGRHICEATWEYHRTSYVPVTMAQQAREQRLQGKLARLAAHQDTAEAELRAPILLEHAPPVPMAMPIPAAELEEASLIIDAMAAPAPLPAVPAADPDARPRFTDDVEWVVWLLDNPARVTPQDREGLRTAMHSPSFRLDLEMNGIAEATLTALIQTQSEAA